MNDPYDDDDDEYDDDYYDYDHPASNPYQWYFKFDVGTNSPISSWISDMLNELNIFGSTPVPNWPIKKFPVNSWNPNAGGKDKLQYLGSNYANEPIWKSKYFVIDPINSQYKDHIKSHAIHFISQPKYYKGLFDILN